MIRSNSLLLLISFVILTPIISHGMEEQVVPDSESKAVVEEQVVPESKATDAIPNGKISVWTDYWHGARNLLGGSSTKSFIELHRAGTLKVTIQSDKPKATYWLNQAIKRRFDGRSLTNRDGFQSEVFESRTNQEKISEIFRIARDLENETHKEFRIDKDDAATYNPLQQTALELIIDQDANIHQPELKRIEDTKIAVAKEEYRLAMERNLAFARIAAQNKRYVYVQAKEKTPYDLQNQNHYTSIETYTALLNSKRKPATTKESKA
ncbi:hypothetical protein KBC04_04555 [Candidatus Babeliales bacterium]|nr:hypothetical protein [Candidatus Babeliales bacterium]MBP9844092.1 hypothetical protein [Candidatus Babeliales bacterium]